MFVLDVVVEELLAENDLYRRAGRVMQITTTKVATACVFDGRTDQVPSGLEAGLWRSGSLTGQPWIAQEDCIQGAQDFASALGSPINRINVIEGSVFRVSAVR